VSSPGTGTAPFEGTVRAYLERIAERDSAVRAWAHLDPKAALAQAQAADAQEPRSPLHGVPVGVKDIIDTKDLPTEYGSPIYAGHQPDADAACVARLRDAGAVVLGKTKTTEFATFHPAETVNPHDPERTPGGSSSGSAAAVADGMVPVALGTQTAGSVIRPAAFCGVLGFKPTHGLLDLRGVRQLSGRLDTLGMFAREVDDLERLFGALGGPPPSPPPAGSPRVAFARTARWQLVEPDAQRALEDAARALGAEEIELPEELEQLVDAQATVMAVEVAATTAYEYEHHRERLSEELRELIERGLATERGTYEAALEARERGVEALPRVFGAFDVLMAPTARGQAPRSLQTTGDAVFCRAWTLAGTPAVSVPGKTGSDGMPIGVQLIAAPHRDAELLAAARWAHERLEP
jgi:Asp-tRNA(Asn)/Glu-tRNA(Gln) amidotransferase A subunit family amidase